MNTNCFIYPAMGKRKRSCLIAQPFIVAARFRRLCDIGDRSQVPPKSITKLSWTLVEAGLGPRWLMSSRARLPGSSQVPSFFFACGSTRAAGCRVQQRPGAGVCPGHFPNRGEADHGLTLKSKHIVPSHTYYQTTPQCI